MLQIVKVLRRLPTNNPNLCRLQQNVVVFSTSSIKLDKVPPPEQSSSSFKLSTEPCDIVRPHTSAIFICNSCDRSFKSERSLKQHQKLSQKCQNERRIIRPEDLQDYKDTIVYDYPKPEAPEPEDVNKIILSPNQIACPHCGSVGLKSNHARHLKRCKVLNPDKQRISQPKTVNCPHCSTSLSYASLQKHIKYSCPKFFPQKRKMEKSDVEELLPGNLEYVVLEDNTKLIICPHCKVTMTSRSNLHRHIRNSCPALFPHKRNSANRKIDSSPFVEEEVILPSEPSILMSSAPKPSLVKIESSSQPSCEHCGKIVANQQYLSRHYKFCSVLHPPKKKLKDDPIEETEVKAFVKPAKVKEVPKMLDKSSNDSLIIDPKPVENGKTMDERLEEERKLLLFKDEREMFASYFDLVVNVGSAEEALQSFEAYKRNPVAAPYVQCPEVYNSLLRGFGRLGDVDKVKQLWQDMLDADIDPTQSSFVSYLLSFHQADDNPITRQRFKNVLDQFHQAGFSIEQAIRQGDFLLSDKKHFVQALSRLSSIDPLAASDNLLTEQPELVSPLRYYSTNHLSSQLDTVMDRQKLDTLMQRQLDMENSLMVSVPSIVCNQDAGVMREFTESLSSAWRLRVKNALSRIYTKSEQPIYARGSKLNLRLFMTSLPLDKLTDIVMTKAEYLLTCEMFSLPVGSIKAGLGEDVMAMYHSMIRTEKESYGDYQQGLSAYHDWYCDPAGTNCLTHKDALDEAMKEVAVDLQVNKWPRSVRMAIGSELFNVMMSEIVIDRDVHNNVVSNGKIFKAGSLVEAEAVCEGDPAFSKIFRKRANNYDIEEVKPHPSLSPLYDNMSLNDLKFPPSDLPMIVPPLPWLSQDTGGYLTKKSRLVRYPETTFMDHENMLSDLPPGGLDPILDSLNQLGSVAWIVNKPILELACQLFVHPDTDPDLVSALDIPLHPSNIPSDVHQLSSDIKDALRTGQRLSSEQAVEYRNYFRDMSLFARLKSESYSLWCTSLYRLSLAKHFQDHVLWFPHNIDFRGRCYPIPPLLNHMGADLARSLLVFAKGKKLGSEGFRWLKLHTINLTGTMKRESVEDRLEFVDSIMDKIIDSATRPFDGEKWWLDSDDPWQTLSACMEIKRALEHPRGVEDYVCHLPIHQDGSCNGLQHYAALGRDTLGAGAVNLVPADKPQDVYSEIAAIVDRRRGEDAESGLEIAKICEGFIKRKVVKQTVMTTVYGVTNYGATLQIKKQLKDIEDFPLDYVDPASKYLAKKTFESLNELFTASQEIQDWLTACAGVISKDCKSNVSWVTPLGYPVIQPYSKTLKKDKQIGLDVGFYQKRQNRAYTPPVVRVSSIKNRNGFPPNFIHSLDSSHMMLTSLYLWPKGITFASVHDCFWTHACDVESMNKVCRDQFIALHSSPILEQLSEHFITNFMELNNNARPKLSDSASEKRRLFLNEKLVVERTKREMLFKNIPSKGDLDLNVINNSTYFFS